MRAVLVTLLLVGQCLAKPSMEDNKLPTDQELMGQPEEVASLGLPTDEESFNRLSVFFNPSKPSAPVGSGTYHFVSSTFPVDARGFHESVFDGIGDYFPSWPAAYKRGQDYPSNPTLAQRLGLQPRNKFSKRSDSWAERSLVRNKRMVSAGNNSQEIKETHSRELDENPSCVYCKDENAKLLTKREVEPQRSIEQEINTNDNHLTKRFAGQRYVRGMEMGSFGFHGDVFNGDFGDFTTMKKRARGSMGFHGDTFSDGFGDFATMKRSINEKDLKSKLNAYMDLYMRDEEGSSNKIKTPTRTENGILNKIKPEMTAIGLYGDNLNRDFGDIEPFKKRRPMGAMGFHGDTFSQGFGDFDTVKKRRPMGSSGFHGDTFSQGFGDFDTYKKRRPMGAMGFHGDTFSQGFGDFDTVKKRRPMGSSGFHGDTFSQGFGDFDTYKKRNSAATYEDVYRVNGPDSRDKRRPMGSSGFHGDTFSQGFGDFDTYKKRRPEMDSAGFHGDTFSKGFGEFEPFKKRRPMGAMGFHGDTFSQGFGDFDTVKKRRPMGSSGFHGDTFSQGFGDFDTYKKRRPEMDSAGFHGDTFNRGFGEFDMYKRSEGKSCCDSSIQRHQDMQAH